MNVRILKYRDLLSKFPNCPPSNYKEISNSAFRWVHSDPHSNDFTPVNIIKDPPQRILDESDLSCKGYGLSLFDERQAAVTAYKRQLIRRRAHLLEGFVQECGNCIAIIELDECQGIAGDLNETTRHFTFHEYIDSTLESKIIEIFSIFDADEEIDNT